jgi:hypothetical protein
MVMAEGTQQLEIDSGDRRLREQYQTDFRARLDWFKHVSSQREIPLLPISTEEDVAVQVRRILGVAGAR